MYLVTACNNGPEIVKLATKSPPAGPAMDPQLAAQATRLEVWATEFADVGPDYCEFKLFRDGALIGTGRVNGY